MTTRSIASGTCGATSLGGFTGACSTACASAPGFSPVKSRCPVSASHATIAVA
jgi:hypothetical protein